MQAPSTREIRGGTTELTSARFRQYVTSTAFSISLSANMVLALQQVKHIKDWENPYLNRITGYKWSSLPKAYLSARSALERRGLSIWCDSSGPKLTEAGTLVLELCRIAGLTAEENNAREQAS